LFFCRAPNVDSRGPVPVSRIWDGRCRPTISHHTTLPLSHIDCGCVGVWQYLGQGCTQPAGIEIFPPPSPSTSRPGRPGRESEASMAIFSTPMPCFLRQLSALGRHHALRMSWLPSSTLLSPGPGRALSNSRLGVQVAVASSRMKQLANARALALPISSRLLQHLRQLACGEWTPSCVQKSSGRDAPNCTNGSFLRLLPRYCGSLCFRLCQAHHRGGVLMLETRSDPFAPARPAPPPGRPAR